MSKILIIHTGGTIGMTRTADGYRPDGEYFRNAIFHMDSLKAQGMPKWDFIECDPLLDSSRMSVKEWNGMAKLISDNYDSYDGFVILHGTDTMAYSASALSFMLENLNKPVILTGSQIPLCETRSDGRDNMITSMMIAGEGKVREVCIYFGGLLIRGNRAIKYSAQDMRAFISPNYPVLANAEISIAYNEGALLKHNDEPFHLRTFEDVPIGVIRVFPGIRFDLFESVLTEKLKGVVIETFGSGNVPDDNGVLIKLLQKAKEKDIIITVCSQCPKRIVDMSAYEAGSALRKAGAVSGKDMTTETAVTKLYYLFNKCHSVEEIKTLMEKDLCGELTE
ncbi:MAG: type I asparaginase [Erysipelotrichaceae bacterium]|nr:type I asparaginase [Erysipelotrichaceae bacterium]